MTFSEEELEIHKDDENVDDSKRTVENCARWSKLSRYNIKHTHLILPVLYHLLSDHLTLGGTIHSPRLEMSVRMQI